VRITTIAEVLETLPHMRFTVEVKAGAAQKDLFDTIERLHATHRVIAAGMHDRDRTTFGAYRGATSASTEQAKRMYAMHRLRLARLHRMRADVLQVPEYWGGMHIASPRMVRELKRHGIPVHVWTVNDEVAMRRLLGAGVDGIVTDRPDIGARVMRPDHSSGGPPRS
jgi:glycerophosphoryl diester phosphodiesterase